MTPTMQKLPARAPGIDAQQHVHANISYPRCILHRSEFRAGNADDQIVFRKWRRGFFIFYGAVALLLGGVAVVADWPATINIAAARLGPAAATAGIDRHPN